jgi:hypothetical protein
MFYGILIRMHAQKEHNPPHFHAEYGEFEATFNFDGEITKGEFPSKQTKIVAAWAVLHSESLDANWKLGQNGEQVRDISPLLI